MHASPSDATSFRNFVEKLETDPEEKARLDEARERLRRELDDGDEEALVS